VAIARALAVEPTVMLADEPISMLDVSIRMGILNLMLELKRRKNLAFLYITHDIASARYVADEVIVMYAGHVVERGETEVVLQTPLHPYTRLLLSAVPNPATGLKRHRLEARGEIRTIVDPAPGCRFADRCPAVMEACRVTTPELTEVQPGHWARCYLYPRTTPSGRESHAR
jgi:peptide/nickel transport system ATP-binding protein